MSYLIKFSPRMNDSLILEGMTEQIDKDYTVRIIDDLRLMIYVTTMLRNEDTFGLEIKSNDGFTDAFILLEE